MDRAVGLKISHAASLMDRLAIPFSSSSPLLASLLSSPPFSSPPHLLTVYNNNANGVRAVIHRTPPLTSLLLSSILPFELHPTQLRQ